MMSEHEVVCIWCVIGQGEHGICHTISDCDVTRSDLKSISISRSNDVGFLLITHFPIILSNEEPVSLLLSINPAPISSQPIVSPARTQLINYATEEKGDRTGSWTAQCSHASKKGCPDLHQQHLNAEQTEDFGIVLHQFYPPEMSNDRCQAYTDGELERPIETLQKAFRETAHKRQSINVGSAVVHWFKGDLWLHDGRALYAAYQFAKEHQVPLIGLYIVSPED
ncbi:unnamed protein product [Penicillium egyptiacum]|uniref:Photolyase/cryptochrome alpha/beta domain-containing protein n=1 Tax=Penicillium egyptiacum TaxID=1303716 RepID=A0A9W4K4Q1_9EURO|nr:unnamed protein product [Penicillium egyptiacum]